MSSSWTKRDYEAIAMQIHHAIQDLYDRGKYAELEGSFEVMGRLADLFAMDNSRFSRERFKTACAPDQWKQRS